MTAITRNASIHPAHRALRLPHRRPASLDRYELVLAWTTGGIGLAAVIVASLGTVLFLN
jgi:hypothetical protein